MVYVFIVYFAENKIKKQKKRKKKMKKDNIKEWAGQKWWDEKSLRW